MYAARAYQSPSVPKKQISWVWEGQLPVVRAPPDLISEISCEPYNENRSLP